MSIPAPHAGVRMMTPIGDGDIATLRFGDNAAPPLLFAHANGFCASAYRQMLIALGDRFDVFAVDLRGHGRSSLPTSGPPHRGLDLFGADVSRLLDRLTGNRALHGPWMLAGHSLGAVAVTFAAVGRSDVAGLKLIEPVAIPSSLSMLARSPLWPALAPRLPLVGLAQSRRAVWPDRAAAKASYARKPLFATWAAGVLDDYLEDGLTDGEGGVRLSCAPAWEAANFAAQAHDFWGALAKAPAPVAVLAANHPSTTVRKGARARFRRLGAAVVEIGGSTHLFPFEEPQEAANFLAAG